MTQADPLTEARFRRFLNSPVAKLHTHIATEVVSELHLDFELRGEEVHAVCAMCRGTVAPVTRQGIGYVYTLDSLATLFMAHFMQRHYEQEGRHDD